MISKCQKKSSRMIFNPTSIVANLIWQIFSDLSLWSAMNFVDDAESCYCIAQSSVIDITAMNEESEINGIVGERDEPQASACDAQ